jgi:hypothetical protein
MSDSRPVATQPSGRSCVLVAQSHPADGARAGDWLGVRRRVEWVGRVLRGPRKYAAPMLDHVVLTCRSKVDRSRPRLRAGAGTARVLAAQEPRPGAGGFGTEGKPSFWISDQRRPVSENVHVAFTVQDRADG